MNERTTVFKYLSALSISVSTDKEASFWLVQKIRKLKRFQNKRFLLVQIISANHKALMRQARGHVVKALGKIDGRWNVRAWDSRPEPELAIIFVLKLIVRSWNFKNNCHGAGNRSTPRTLAIVRLRDKFYAHAIPNIMGIWIWNIDVLFLRSMLVRKR